MLLIINWDASCVFAEWNLSHVSAPPLGQKPIQLRCALDFSLLQQKHIRAAELLLLNERKTLAYINAKFSLPMEYILLIAWSAFMHS